MFPAQFTVRSWHFTTMAARLEFMSKGEESEQGKAWEDDGKLVRIWPPARRIDPVRGELPRCEEPWNVGRATQTELRLDNPRPAIWK